MKDGTAPESIRRKGASGDLPVSLGEKIEILVFLSTHPDVEISQRARHSLRHWNTQELDRVLSDPSTSPAVIDFVFHRLLEEQKDLDQTQDAIPSGARAPHFDTQELEAGSTSSNPADSGLTVTPGSETGQGPASGAGTDPGKETLLQRIARLTVPQKVRRALVGSHEKRARGDFKDHLQESRVHEEPCRDAGPGLQPAFTNRCQSAFDQAAERSRRQTANDRQECSGRSSDQRGPTLLD